MRENLLKAAEGRVEEKIAELKKIEATIRGLLKQHDDQQEEKLRRIVKVYEAMKPKDTDQLKYLKENMECEGLVHRDKVISVELPQFVELEVTETDPGFKGDTAQGATKPAKLETGATIQVPQAPGITVRDQDGAALVVAPHHT